MGGSSQKDGVLCRSCFLPFPFALSPIWGSLTFYDGSRWPQDGPKFLKTSSWCSKIALRCSKKTSRDIQDVPRSLQVFIVDADLFGIVCGSASAVMISL